jgi:F-type H+-transporting ATPase subunit delta
MKETRIAKRYARALFDFAVEQSSLEEVSSDMGLVFKVCGTNRDFRLLLASPVIKADKKIAVIKAVFSDHFHKITLAYMEVIARKGREMYIRDIAERFTELFKEYKGIKTVYLTTATEIGDQTRNRILQLLKEATHATIEMVEKVDKDLIGGFVLRYDDKQYDASLARQIQQLQRDFDENVYIKGF